MENQENKKRSFDVAFLAGTSQNSETAKKSAFTKYKEKSEPELNVMQFPALRKLLDITGKF